MPIDWLTDARPLFTTLGPTVPWTRETIDRRVAQAAEDGCDTVMAFVQDEGYALWPSPSVPVAPRAQGRDLVHAWCEACHLAGMRFVAQWMGVHVQTVTGARHPGWFQRDTYGMPSTVMCVNSAFGGYLIGQIREVVTGYPVDGVYLDGLYARQGGCYCDACRSMFEASLERPLALATPSVVADVPGAEHWLDRWGAPGIEDPDLAAFRFRTVESFLTRLRRTMNDVRPGAALILDTLGPQAGYWPNGHDLRRLRGVVDAFALECYPDQVREPLWHAALESEMVHAEGRLPVWALRWISRDPDGDLVSVPAATLEAHVATTIVHATAPAIVEMNLYALDESLRPTVRRTLTDTRVFGEWRKGAVPMRWAGILADRRLQAAASARGASRRAFDPVAGAWLALTEAHLPVEIVTDEGLADGRALRDLRVLVVPDVTGIPDADATAICAAVEDGMGLVLTGRSIVGALGRRLGVVEEGVGHRAGRIGPEATGGAELVNYLRLADHPVTAGTTTRVWSYPGIYARITRAPGDRLGAILDADYAAMDGERWFGWLPGEEAWPLGHAFPVGAGRVVVWAPPLDTVFFRQGRPEASAFLTQAVRWVANAQPAIRIDAPVTVEARSWVAPDDMMVALANRSTNDLYAIGAGVSIGAATSSMAGAGTGEGTMRAQFPRAILPIAGVSISVDWTGPAPTVTTLSGAKPRVKRGRDRLTVSIDSLAAYEVVRLIR